MTREQRDLLRKQIDLRTREPLAARLSKFGGSHASDVPKAGAGEVVIGRAGSELAPPRPSQDDMTERPPALLAIVALLGAVVCVRLARSGWAFALTVAGAVMVVATVFTSLFPRVMVSSTDFANSLTIDNASSAHYTLAVMSVVALIVAPIILLYQAWTYYVFRARVGAAEVPDPGEAVVSAAPTGEPAA